MSNQARLHLTAHTLGVDLVSAEVVRALRGAGIRPILLKGPVLAAWLYAGGDFRPYFDSDFLVAPTDEAAAHETLAALGFVSRLGSDEHPGMADGHCWTRNDEIVELHTSLEGVQAPPEVVWRALVRDVRSFEVSGETVEVLGAPALALHVALHAAQHGRDVVKPMEDLARALARVTYETWDDAATLAHELQATERFVAGLRLHSKGRELVERLGLRERPSVATELRASSAHSMAQALEDLRGLPGLSAKFRRLRSELFPSSEFLEWWSPLGARTLPRRLASMCLRVGWLVLRAPGAIYAWLSAWVRVRRV